MATFFSICLCCIIVSMAIMIGSAAIWTTVTLFGEVVEMIRQYQYNRRK